MAKKQARLGIIGRDLMAAAMLGPGPALQAAIDQLMIFDEDGAQSRVNPADLRQLADRVLESSPQSQRMAFLSQLAHHSSITAQSLCAYGLPTMWEHQETMELAERLSRSRSTRLRSDLQNSLMDLTPQQQQRLCRDWWESPCASQRAIAARVSSGETEIKALSILSALSSDEDPDVRQAVVQALLELAHRRPGEVIEAMRSWAEAPDKNKLWVMTRILSHAPLNRELQPVIEILQTMARELKGDKDVRRWVISVIRALARRHRNRPVQDALAHWLDGDDPILAEVAAEALRRIV